MRVMDTKKAGRMGALITNQKLTKEGRSKAAKKGWRNRRKSEEYPQKIRGINL